MASMASCSFSLILSSPVSTDLSSPFLSRSSSSSLRVVPRHQHLRSGPSRIPSPTRAADLDPDTLVAIAVGVAGIGVGVGVPIFYETQMKGAANRENDQPCFPCSGSGAQTCRFCLGTGSITVELDLNEKEVSRCVNCEGAGSITCTTCQGSGVQPRYLDRREFKDDD